MGKYRVHEYRLRMSRDQLQLEQFLNSLEGEIVTIIPNVVPRWTLGGMGAAVNMILVVEKSK
jgi:hypothetical protein